MGLRRSVRLRGAIIVTLAFMFIRCSLLNEPVGAGVGLDLGAPPRARNPVSADLGAPPRACNPVGVDPVTAGCMSGEVCAVLEDASSGACVAGGAGRQPGTCCGGGYGACVQGSTCVMSGTPLPADCPGLCRVVCRLAGAACPQDPFVTYVCARPTVANPQYGACCPSTGC